MRPPALYLTLGRRGPLADSGAPLRVVALALTASEGGFRTPGKLFPARQGSCRLSKTPCLLQQVVHGLPVLPFLPQKVVRPLSNNPFFFLNLPSGVPAKSLLYQKVVRRLSIKPFFLQNMGCRLPVNPVLFQKVVPGLPANQSLAQKMTHGLSARRVTENFPACRLPTRDLARIFPVRRLPPIDPGRWAWFSSPSDRPRTKNSGIRTPDGRLSTLPWGTLTLWRTPSRLRQSSSGVRERPAERKTGPLGVCRLALDDPTRFAGCRRGRFQEMSILLSRREQGKRRYSVCAHSSRGFHYRPANPTTLPVDFRH